MNIARIFLFLALFLSTTSAWASDLDAREHIEVVGASEVKVVPDEFVLRAQIQSFAKKLDRAASQNESSVRATFKAMTALGVPRRYVVTDQVHVTPVTEGYRERGNYRRVGYTVSREVMVVLHDARRIEPAMRKLFALGIDRLSMQTSHTKMAEHVARAEAEAAGAARARAKILTKALGRKLGRAVAISQAPRAGRRTSNFVYSASTPNLGDALSLGKLKVAASVRVKFLLTP